MEENASGVNPILEAMDARLLKVARIRGQICERPEILPFKWNNKFVYCQPT